jgi:hypothetical protein
MKIGIGAGFSYAGGVADIPELPGGEVLNLVSDAGVTLSTTFVTGWNDQTASALHVSAAGAARPTVNSSWQNGRPGIVFDGVSNKMTRSTGAFLAGSALMVVMVVAATVDPDVTDPGSNERAYFGIQSASGNDFRCNTRFDSAVRRVGWNGSTGPTISGTYGMGTVPNVVSWATDGTGGAANFVFRVNGTAKTTSGALGDTTANSLTLEIGGGNVSHACTIGQVLVYTTFDMGVLAQAEDFLAYAWAL